MEGYGSAQTDARKKNQRAGRNPKSVEQLKREKDRRQGRALGRCLETTKR